MTPSWWSRTCERNIALGLSPKDATQRAMEEVSGPVIAVALVLGAVFIPTAFMGGITGQFYKQFALTIAVSTVISAFNSLTLSPALSAILLKPHGAKPDWFQRLLNFFFGWFFWIFNWVFRHATNFYSGLVRSCIRVAVIALLLYGGLLYLTGRVFEKVPSGFIPTQDKGYLVVFAQLPDAASLERTREVILKCGEIARKTPGVISSVEFPGFSLLAGGNAPNAGTIFLGLDDFEKRKHDPRQSMGAILGSLMGQYSADPGGDDLRLPAARGRRHRQRRGLQDADQGHRRPGQGRARGGDVRHDDEGQPDAGPRRTSSRRCGPACRSSTSRSTAPRPRASACASATSSTRCRSTSARFT